jgi:protein-S-isoprenylcysteine O-methyltransferase Ste14
MTAAVEGKEESSTRRAFAILGTAIFLLLAPGTGFLRHPIYTAVLGIALVSGEIHAPIALAVVTLAYWRKIRLEERALHEAFGEHHEAYRRESWTWIPGVY